MPSLFSADSISKEKLMISAGKEVLDRSKLILALCFRKEYS
jgi:hypothetical protein